MLFWLLVVGGNLIAYVFSNGAHWAIAFVVAVLVLRWLVWRNAGNPFEEHWGDPAPDDTQDEERGA